MREPVAGPSSPGSVVLDLGAGALVLHTPPELDGREIEISLSGNTPAGRTHALVRPRVTSGQAQYAAIYPQLPAGTYTMERHHHSSRHRHHPRRPGHHRPLARTAATARRQRRHSQARVSRL